uniref:Uncharacterized protein n=1 Tax=Romanomermis culicivorax TaxID=13658 RepID=A0A915IRZ7_ROMCU
MSLARHSSTFKLLIERVRQRRQQLNEELSSSAAGKENISCSAVASKHSETPSKKSSFNENDLNRQSVLQKNDINNHQSTRCYPLDELEELAKVVASQQVQDSSASDSKISSTSPPRRRFISSSQTFDSEIVHKMASEESRKARMVALAARIDSYEDDQSSSCTSSSRRNLKASLESLESFLPPPLVTFQTTREENETAEEKKKFEEQNSKIESGIKHFIRPYYPNIENRPKIVASTITEQKKQFSALASRITGTQSTMNGNNSSMQSSKTVFKSNVMPEKTDEKLSVRILPGLKPRPNPSTTDKKSVAMLRDRWEYATRQGLPLKPEDSFTKADDEITVAALRIFKPVKPPLIPRKMIHSTCVSASPKSNIKKQWYCCALIFSCLENRVVVNVTKTPEKIEETSKLKEDNSETPIAILESSVDVQSYTEEETLDEDDTEYDTELENCLDQAIDAATKAARDQSMLMHHQNISKNETYHTAFTSNDADTTTHSKLEDPKNLDLLTPTFNSTFLDDSRASMAVNTSRMVHT